MTSSHLHIKHLEVEKIKEKGHQKRWQNVVSCDSSPLQFKVLISSKLPLIFNMIQKNLIVYCTRNFQ